MIVVVLVGLAGLAIAGVVVWHPKLSAALDRRPWWLAVIVPGATLGLIMVLATRVTDPVQVDAGRAAAALAVGVAVSVGGPVTVAVLKGAERTGLAGISRVMGSPGSVSLGPLPSPVVPPSARAVTPTQAEEPEIEVLRGGTWIGLLERAAIAASLIAEMPEGVAVTVAIKGLARYQELKVRGASERFIIGTLTSGLWAAAAAGVGIMLVR